MSMAPVQWGASVLVLDGRLFLWATETNRQLQSSVMLIGMRTKFDNNCVYKTDKTGNERNRRRQGVAAVVVLVMAMDMDVDSIRVIIAQ
ncbi:MAG: hypothetical protein JOS17DRAFT_794429 [Linnemannia elongata]|nr:MAG: hypothetical protein JOS17DRAFT_794429 [Linnemannia elongata]